MAKFEQLIMYAITQSITCAWPQTCLGALVAPRMALRQMLGVVVVTVCLLILATSVSAVDDAVSRCDLYRTLRHLFVFPISRSVQVARDGSHCDSRLSSSDNQAVYVRQSACLAP